MSNAFKGGAMALAALAAFVCLPPAHSLAQTQDIFGHVEDIKPPETLRDVKAALALAEKAVRLEPGMPLYRNTLGVVYYRAERYREAVEALRSNLDKPEDSGLAFDLYFLAMSHHRLGETARARDYFDWAVRWTQAQRGLSEGHLEELTRFRAEATELLGIETKKD